MNSFNYIYVTCPECNFRYGVVSADTPVNAFACICGFGNRSVEPGVWIRHQATRQLIRYPGTLYFKEGRPLTA